MRVGRLIPVLALGLTLQAAHAQSTSGKPMDADEFREQSEAAPVANPMMQQVIQQSLNGPTKPAAQTGPQPMWTLGISGKTCKELYNPTGDSLGLEAESWAQGFWTGLNTLNPKGHNVGKDSDPKTIMADITKSCAASPDKTLMQTVSETYALYLTRGK